MNGCGFDCTMANRRAAGRYLAKQEADRRSTLPLGTEALVAPLVPAASLAQTPENGQAKKEEQRNKKTREERRKKNERRRAKQKGRRKMTNKKEKKKKKKAKKKKQHGE